MQQIDPPLPLRQRSPDLHARRRAALLAATGGARLVIFGMGSALGAGTRSHGRMRFLAGWDSHESASLLLLAPDGCRLLLASPFMEPAASELVPDLNPEHLPTDLWSQAVTAFLGSESCAVVGLDEMPLGIYRSLAALLDPATDVTPAIDALRQVKEPAALALHRDGAVICDRVFAAMADEITPGRSGRESQRVLEGIALQHGAEYCRSWLTIRPAADHPRYWPEETSREAQKGDQVLFGIALMVDGHWAHGLRMGHLGPVPDALRSLHAGVNQALNAGLAALVPGCPVTEAKQAMTAHIDALALEFPDYSAHTFRCGHALGLTYEEPGLTQAFPQTFGQYPEPPLPEPGPILRPGMVLELHPNIFLSGLGGAALGQMIEITPQGAAVLFHTPCSLLEL